MSVSAEALESELMGLIERLREHGDTAKALSDLRALANPTAAADVPDAPSATKGPCR